MLVGEGDQPLNFLAVGPPVRRQHVVVELRTPWTMRVTHLGSHVQPEHDLEVQPFVADNLEHRHCMLAAIVKTQVLPVFREDQQVFPNLFASGVGAVVRALPLAVARVADRVAELERRTVTVLDVGTQEIKHT